MNSTYNNHYKFGYNNLFDNRRLLPSDIWNFKIGKPKKTKSFFESAQDAASLLWENTYNMEKVLCMSGGLDSELAAFVFISKKLPFTVAIANWQNTNNYDIINSIRFCKKHNINYKIYNINLLDFFSSQIFTDLSNNLQIDNPYILPHMFFMSQISGIPILGNGEPDIFGEENNIYVNFKEQPASWHRYCNKILKRGCGGFWEYTPELMVSYILEISNLIKTNYFKSNKFSDFKAAWMNKNFDLKLRKKYTGFEKFHKENTKFMNLVLDKTNNYSLNKSFNLQTSILVNVNDLSNYYSTE